MSRTVRSALWLAVSAMALAYLLGLLLLDHGGDPGPPVYTWPDTAPTTTCR